MRAQIDNSLKQLYKYAAESRFDEFDALFKKALPLLTPAERQNAYLIRAQIKLYICDETLTQDLAEAGETGAPLFPCIHWQCDTPNRLVIFNRADGSLKNHLKNLSTAAALFDARFGEAGKSMVRQFNAEILYFSGDHAAAIALSKQQLDAASLTDGFLSRCLLFRCYLATGAIPEAERAMQEVISFSNAYPQYIASYTAMRTWANLTTGWSGDTPRFLVDHKGKSRPFLDDRLAAIRKGFANLSPLEAPFVRYARQSDPNFYAMSEYYMDIFYAMYWFYTQNYREMEKYFIKAGRIAAASGLIMPFVECGQHIVAVLEYVKKRKLGCSAEWLDRVADSAAAYEKHLIAYRN